MFSVEFLHQEREWEIQRCVAHCPPRARVLEIGGGTGFQAKRLVEMGFHVASIDLLAAPNVKECVFPVIPYDGLNLPFAKNTFDVVFSSNVLEHVANPTQLHRELVGVLKADGVCIHVVPTASWRWWTSVTHYLDILQRRTKRSKTNSDSVPDAPNRPTSIWGRRLRKLVPIRHGEVGSSFSELWLFSRWGWRRHFQRFGYHVVAEHPLRLFYTGHMVCGPRWSIASREVASRFLGSSCRLFVVKPVQQT